MTPADVLEVAQEALYVMLKVGGPIMGVALIIGLSISFVQALTQIQEMTLSFIPKIIFTLGMAFLLLPFISGW